METEDGKQELDLMNQTLPLYFYHQEFILQDFVNMWIFKQADSIFAVNFFHDF